MRVSANAVIVRDNKLLLIRFDDENGVHYNLPGGGVDAGESMHEALARECWEEASARVEVGELLGAWEYVPEKQNREFGPLQKLGMIFRCELKEGSEPKMPLKPDPHQVGVDWMPLEKVESAPIYPRMGAELVDALRGSRRAFFLSSV